MSQRVYVGMSGGVDSSLSAALLVEQGYDVTGVYMKNWTRSLPGLRCPWADDLADAKRVAVRLGIDFKVFDFETQYKHKVVDYMIREYKEGHTPNPDIMCNQEVKFKLFLETALEDGADLIATGHYARKSDSFECSKANSQSLNKSPATSLYLSAELASLKQSSPNHDMSQTPYTDCSQAFSLSKKSLCANLFLAEDSKKDQTYFLYRVTGEALAKTLFPIGDLTKTQVRAMASKRGLTTADKPDSQGICFVGQIGIRDFLNAYIETSPGKIIDKKSGQTLGYHDGAIFYTIGQRHGLNVGGGLPYYVVGKDMAKNEVYITTDLNDSNLWQKNIRLTNLHWINYEPKAGSYRARIRHQAPLIKAVLNLENSEVIIELEEAQRAITSGQSVVIYDGQVCLGGGIVF